MSTAPRHDRPRPRLAHVNRILQQMLREMRREGLLPKAGTAQHPSQANPKTKAAHPTATVADFLANKLLVNRAIQQGIPYALFEAIQKSSPIGENQWAALLGMSLKTLQRHEQDQRRFKALHSQRIIEVFEALQMGLDAFGDGARLALWLQQPNHALGAYKPIDLLTDSFGTELVLGELHRVQHGVFA